MLRRTHEMASRFAQQIADISGISLDPALVQTNIVRFELDRPAGAVCDRLYDAGVFMLPNGADAVRAVFYLDIADEDVDRAADAVAAVLRT